MAEEAKMVPKLRFKGFSEPWRQEALSKEFKRINERNNGQFGKDRWISVANMFFQDPDKVQTNNIDTRTYVMRKGDIAFEGHPNKEFKFGRFVANDIGDGVVSELFPVYKHVRDYDSDYWKYAIHLNWIMTPIFAKSITSSGNSSNKLDAKHFLRQEIRIPSLNEQQNIGDLLKKMDAILTLHEEKLGQLKALKRGMLQKLFPAQGDVVPVLRQKGFKDAWKKHKFMESIDSITDFRGRTPKKLGMNWSTEGVLALSAQNVKDGYIDKTIDAHYGSQDLYDKWMGGRELHKGQVVFTTEAPMGNVARIPDENKYILSQRTIAFNIKEDMLTESFLMYLLESPGVRNNLLRFSSGGTAKGVSQKTLSSLMVIIPTSLKEQARISFEFYNLDYLITLHQHKLDKLHSLKKFLLQNLFI